MVSAMSGLSSATRIRRVAGAAEAAAGAVKVAYAEEPAAGGFDAPGAETVRLADLKPHHEDIARGDAEAAFRARADPHRRRHR